MGMTPARQGHLAILLFSVLVAGSFSLGALAANDIAPGALNAVRFAIASTVIGFAVLLTGNVQRSAPFGAICCWAAFVVPILY